MIQLWNKEDDFSQKAQKLTTIRDWEMQLLQLFAIFE